MIIFAHRFHLTSLVSRVVNQANNVLDSYSLNNGKYKLAIKNIEVKKQFDDVLTIQEYVVDPPKGELW